MSDIIDNDEVQSRADGDDGPQIALSRSRQTYHENEDGSFDNSKYMKAIENHLTTRQRTQKARELMRMHKNLDLDDYNKYISHFMKYSSQWFEQDSVFTQEMNKYCCGGKCLSPTQKLMRSSKLSGEALFNKIKALPPSQNDNVSLD